MNIASFIDVSYIVAAILFILGLKKMTHPRTAVKGNFLGATAMAIAVLVTLLHQDISGYALIIIGIAIGGLIGGVLAVKIQMTAMPQMVAIFNGFGGAASIFVAAAELLKGNMTRPDELIATAAAGVIGSVTLTGSFIAFGKLQELKIFKKSINIPGGKIINAILVIAILVLSAMLVTAEPGCQMTLYYMVVGLSSLLGILLVIPIGGADMPVVIALLNSYSGLAAAATGFVLPNNILIIAGSLVGASGVILTKLMCKAMNRSLANVIFGGMDGGPSSDGGDAEEMYKTVRSTSPDDLAMLLDAAQRVVFVPGYGMAVAQAQHAVHDLGKMLEERDIEVEYAIHPVAGRMPGHMNVLLAEADVDYDKLIEMDDINQTMAQVDVAIVIGANDTVNPIARTDPNSPIAGMPIINVDQARTVVVIKRSLSPGFAGIPNPLFGAENTLMLFGDGKQMILDTITAVKEG